MATNKIETWHTQEEIEPSIQTINITGPVVLRPLLSSPIGTCSLLYCTTTTPPEAEPSPAQLSPPEESRRKNFGCSNAPDRDHDLTEYSAVPTRKSPIQLPNSASGLNLKGKPCLEPDFLSPGPSAWFLKSLYLLRVGEGAVGKRPGYSRLCSFCIESRLLQIFVV